MPEVPAIKKDTSKGQKLAKVISTALAIRRPKIINIDSVINQQSDEPKIIYDGGKVASEIIDFGEPE